MTTTRKQSMETSETSLDVEAWIEQHLGDPADFIEESREYMERLKRMESMVAGLTEQYPNQWAALTESGELLIVPTLADLRAKFEELGTRPGSNVIEYLDTDPTPWLL